VPDPIHLGEEVSSHFILLSHDVMLRDDGILVFHLQ
jgi:hypothetical protein